MILLKNKYSQPLFWGLLHGLNDLAAGFFLAKYTFLHSYNDSFFCVTLYAIIGFGGQLPVGFWMDRKRFIKPFAIASFILLPLAVLSSFFSLGTAIIFSGLASAFVHVTGGTICLQVHKDKTGPLGIFTAPGVLGLTAGSLFGQSGIIIPVLVLISVFILAFVIFKQPFVDYPSSEKKESELDAHDLIMLAILLLMCFRSLIFDVVNYAAENVENGIFYLGVSAFAGKIVGGFLADKIGLKKFIYTTLSIAFLLFQFGKENIYALSAGVACLQSSVPVTLLLMSRSLPFYPATATAFSLGTSIILAGLPLFLVTDRESFHESFNNSWLTAIVFSIFIIGWLIAGKFLFRKT